MTSDDELMNSLREASEGLLFPSEMDYPFEVFIFGDTEKSEIDESGLFKLLNRPLDVKIEQADFDTLFYWTVREQDWHSDKDRENVKRFQKMVDIIKTNLKDIKVFRAGSVEIDVYITGRAPSGNLVLISTKQLQT